MKELIADYKNGMGIYDVCEKYHIGKIKVKKILSDNGVELRKRGKQALNTDDFVVKDFHIEKYKEEDGFHYIAVDKNNGKSYNDYMNNGGFLTTHIKNVYGVDVPSLYDRRMYYMKTGNYWWEQWFNIIKVNNNENVKKCPYCEWTTNDLENRSGAFTLHLKEAHNKTIEEYIKEYPNDIDYFPKYKKELEKKELMKDDKYYVVCPICGEKLKRITLWHLKSKHNMTMTEFRKKYPNQEVNSYMTHLQDVENFKLGNLVVSKDRFISKYEKELQDFLTENGIKHEANRQILIGKEIDILIYDKRIGIEFDGLKFHAEWFGKKDRNYHCDKTNRCNEKGYALIHIFEDEYVNKKEIVLNKLRHILKLNYALPKIGGRQITVKEIYKHDAQVFLEQYHIQGFSSSTLYLGGYYGDELVAVMSFKHGNVKNPNWELTRFATKSSYYYQGVASKMFKYFIRIYDPNIIVSFADRRWTPWQDNNLYTKLGFELNSINKPDYRYYNEKVDRFKRIHKMTFSKKQLSKKYGFPMTMTETEMAKELGYDRIWDCGLFKYVWKREGED